MILVKRKNAEEGRKAGPLCRTKSFAIPERGDESARRGRFLIIDAVMSVAFRSAIFPNHNKIKEFVRSQQLFMLIYRSLASYIIYEARPATKTSKNFLSRRRMNLANSNGNEKS